MIVEIRPGEGGGDAVAFAAELAHLVATCAQRAGHHTTVDTSNERLVIVTLPDTAGWARHLAGTHRVQRIPKGAAARHTSTVTVAVLDDGAAPEVELDPADLVEDVFRASGPGGQHRNTSDTAVRLVHVPTGTTVVCAEGRSQWHNRRQARAELVRRLSAAHAQSERSARNDERRDQFAVGDRPSRTWTWNEQRNSATHHPTGRTWRITDLRRGRGLTS